MHDMLFMDHPHWFSFAERAYFRGMPITLRWASGVASSSGAESQRISRLLSRPDVVPIGLGISKELRDSVPVRPPSAPDGSFALIVGRLDIRKNIDAAISAAIESSAISPTSPLLVVGDGEYSRRRIEPSRFVKDGMMDGSVRLLGKVQLAELRWLYENASVTLYLALDEGYGLPPIEAAWFGSRVVVSDIPVFRETMGGAAMFVDPTDRSEISRAIDAAFVMDRLGGDEVENLRRRHCWKDSVARLRAVACEATTR
ncbi:glycosyltransferase [Flexivirga caeni]|uniref:Glycosyltransferase n=1 Tax=Flexivirga caeni TaxID=2294115 RepID=A0A3M9LVE4_9MICO|nr:glycosyltransferase [Flexivirga caeni]